MPEFPTEIHVLIMNFLGDPMCHSLRRERRRAQQVENLVENNEISFYPSAQIGLWSPIWKLYFPRWRPKRNFYCMRCGNIVSCSVNLRQHMPINVESLANKCRCD